MKIKQQKQLNLQQVIEWIEKNRRYGEVFTSDRYNCIHVKVDGFIEFVGEFYEDLFTVEVEEEITEDTLFHHIIEITKDDTHLTWKHTNITEEKDSTSKEFHAYINGEYKCIWRDGELIKE